MSECKCVHKATGAEQSLDELDWERGIWGSAVAGNLEKVQKKIKDINRQDRYGFTALHYAVRNNRIKVAEFLLSCYEVDLTLVTNGGASVLHRAATGASKGPECLELLLKQKQLFCLVDEEGQNFLHKLAQSSPEHYKRIVRDPVYRELENCRDKYDKLPADYI